MRRAAAAGVLVALAACVSTPPTPRLSGKIALDPSGTTAVRVPLEWPGYERSPGDGPVTYEVRVWRARGGLPCEEAFRADELRWNGEVIRVRLPEGDYVWSARAHFLRDGWPCVSGWYDARGGEADDRLLPPRGLARFSVP